ncbi:MAG: hypothetical protein RIG62_03500 [Cyclobacteriaceae bacterium]
MILQADDLLQFTGTTQWFRHPLFRQYTYTEGIHYMAEHGGAYWLMDAVFSWQTVPKVKAEPFQSWTLTVKDHSAVLTATDGNGRQIARQEIEYTDFLLPEITLFFTDHVLLLPSEY